MTLILLFLGCATDDGACADRRDLALTPGGLDVTAEEHPTGWGHSDCFLCHQRWNVHAADCINGVTIDTGTIEADSVDDCVACHGWNGVEKWKDLDGETP